MTQNYDSLPLDEIAEKTASNEGMDNVNRLIGTAQNLIALFVGLTAILSGAGFVIVNVHLSKFTDIHGLNISSNQYIFAGIGFLIFGLINLFVFSISFYLMNFDLKNYVPKTKTLAILKWLGRYLLPIVAISIVLLFLGALNLVRDARFLILEVVSLAVIIVFAARNEIAKMLTRSQYVALWLFVLIIYVLAGGYTYSVSVYSIIPHYLIGGEPKTAILVFKNEAELESFGIAQNPSQKTHTQNILILADLRNGLLILDPTSGQVIAIKEESILGIYDDKVNTQYLVTATPTFTPSSTLTQTSITTPSTTASPVFIPTPTS